MLDIDVQTLEIGVSCDSLNGLDSPESEFTNMRPKQNSLTTSSGRGSSSTSSGNADKVYIYIFVSQKVLLMVTVTFLVQFCGIFQPYSSIFRFRYKVKNF
jgi:hypothetical protein